MDSSSIALHKGETCPRHSPLSFFLCLFLCVLLLLLNAFNDKNMRKKTKGKRKWQVFFWFREFQRQKFQGRHETLEGGLSESHGLAIVHKSSNLCRVKTSPLPSSSCSLFLG